MGQGENEFGRHDFLPVETRTVSAWPDRVRRRGQCHQGFGKDLARRSESGRLLSATNPLARVRRSNAVKSEQNQPTIE
jgi:hypothetical protein